MISEEVLDLLRALEPGVQVIEGWDSELPKYCSVSLDNETEFIAAQCHEGHVVSLVSNREVRSVVADFSRDETSAVAHMLTSSPMKTRTSDRGAATDGDSGRTAGVNTIANLDRPNSRGSLGRHGDLANAHPRQVRDPNAPPAFEDEHGLLRPAERGPRIAFDPDQDLYPPGGAYPRLDPLGPGALRSPSSSGGFPGPGGGMHPELGGRRNPGARYDPTSPFDRAGGHFGGPSDSPFGPNGPFGSKSPF